MPFRSPNDEQHMDASLEPEPSTARMVTIEQEEYNALMAELPHPEIEPQSTSNGSEIDEKFRKIEFYMMIIVGLVLIVLVICKGN
jgi:hypothetical protein